MSDSTSPEHCRFVDEKCDAFEQAFVDGGQPSIAEFLDSAPGEIQETLFAELLAMEEE